VKGSRVYPDRQPASNSSPGCRAGKNSRTLGACENHHMSGRPPELLDEQRLTLGALDWAMHRAVARRVRGQGKPRAKHSFDVPPTRRSHSVYPTESTVHDAVWSARVTFDSWLPPVHEPRLGTPMRILTETTGAGTTALDEGGAAGDSARAVVHGRAGVAAGQGCIRIDPVA
jgi:hypothetical protein